MSKSEYIKKNQEWLQEKSLEEGVEHLEGWQIALTRMHVGDRWELYIPADMGYGKSSLPGIPGGSTLIFDVELLKIQ